MSKKKPAAKKKATPKAKSKPAPKMKPKAARPRSVSPRAQALPGMEQVRNRTLDRICEGIGDVRGDLNRLRGEEKDLQNQAVRVMSADKVTAYRFAGVELVLVPGDAHLRVRTLKVTANTDGDETGSGQDAAATLDEMTADDEADAADLEG